MDLKTATLIAIIGQILSLVFWQSTNLFHLYTVFSPGIFAAINFLFAIIGQGGLILFLITLYSKQK